MKLHFLVITSYLLLLGSCAAKPGTDSMASRTEGLNSFHERYTISATAERTRVSATLFNRNVSLNDTTTRQDVSEPQAISASFNDVPMQRLEVPFLTPGDETDCLPQEPPPRLRRGLVDTATRSVDPSERPEEFDNNFYVEKEGYSSRMSFEVIDAGGEQHRFDFDFVPALFKDVPPKFTRDKKAEILFTPSTSVSRKYFHLFLSQRHKGIEENDVVVDFDKGLITISQRAMGKLRPGPATLWFTTFFDDEVAGPRHGVLATFQDKRCVEIVD